MAATPQQAAELEALAIARQEYEQALVEISAAIDEDQQNIIEAQAAIASSQEQLDATPNTPENEQFRAELVDNIVYNESVIAANTSALETNQSRLAETQDLLNLNTQEQDSITLAVDGPGATPPPVSPEEDPFEAARLAREQDFNATAPTEADVNVDAASTRAKTLNAQDQNTLQQRVSLPSSADWRVRLSLAPGSEYLYNSKSPGILGPLARTNGVVFPYTPSIETAYVAKYDATELTHSNYKGYFYKGSHVESINIRGTFTAQDTREAQYLLAVIHFFRSVTKMFYGATDPNAGVPPPLVFLSGFGQYQFANHPCVVSNFTYNLPSDVDYIRANGFNNFGINLENRRQDLQGSGPPGTGIIGAISKVNRLLNSGLVKDDVNQNGGPAAANSNTGATNSTYVPTKMEISISLYPIQTRAQQSQQFKLQNFANGNLIKGGFW